MSLLPLVLVGMASHVIGQFVPGGPTQPGLPAGCLGSFPDIPKCRASNWHITTADPCIPLGPVPIPSQSVYIKDELNFCINLPDPQSIFLQQNFYNQSLLPSIVQAEGFVQSYCMGSYLPPGSLPLPIGAVRSAHVLKNYTVPGQHYMQIHGYLDCELLKVNCTQSYPDAFDDGGQYDNGPFEPYSGVDNSTAGNPDLVNYVQQAGDGIFCMRICEEGTMHPGLPCDVTQDTKGCGTFMGVVFGDGFQYVDLSAPGITITASVSLPPLPTTTTPISTLTVTSLSEYSAIATVTKSSIASRKAVYDYIAILMFLFV